MGRIHAGLLGLIVVAGLIVVSSPAAAQTDRSQIGIRVGFGDAKRSAASDRLGWTAAIRFGDGFAMEAPRPLTRCFRATGGSEAVDLALQAAMIYTSRRGACCRIAARLQRRSSTSTSPPICCASRRR